jgi:hypothetical protein
MGKCWQNAGCMQGRGPLHRRKDNWCLARRFVPFCDALALGPCPMWRMPSRCLSSGGLQGLVPSCICQPARLHGG